MGGRGRGRGGGYSNGARGNAPGGRGGFAARSVLTYTVALSLMPQFPNALFVAFVTCLDWVVAAN